MMRLAHSIKPFLVDAVVVKERATGSLRHADALGSVGPGDCPDAIIENPRIREECRDRVNAVKDLDEPGVGGSRRELAG